MNAFTAGLQLPVVRLTSSISSYEVADIQYITSCHKKSYDHLARRRNVIDKVHVNNAFLIEIMIILKAIKSHFKGSYDKQNLTLVVI